MLRQLGDRQTQQQQGCMIPQDIIEAWRTLGLPANASFDDVGR
jgi:hypothetical protein